MKLGAISDMHADRHNQLNIEDYFNALVDVVKAEKLDILLIAGDISNDYHLSVQFIKKLNDTLKAVTVLFIPGNHDFWSIDSNHTPAKDILKYFTAQSECLIGRPYIINDDWAIVGHTGWYDYSYASSKFTLERLEKGKFRGATWQDKERILTTLSDKTLSYLAAQQVRRDIESVGGRQIILMTHIVTHPQFVVPTPHRIFDFFNAYIATKDFDDIYRRFPIRYSIMGHVHFRKRLTEHGVTYICPCLGYPRQWRSNHLEQEIRRTLMTFTI